jgi:hypothetical protein
MQVKQETYNQFKDLLFLASPEVKEDVMRLEIGADYIGKNGDKYKCVVNKGNFVWGRLYRYGELRKTIYKDEIKYPFEIIGRDLTLEDVLIFVGEKNRELDKKLVSFRFYYTDKICLQFEQEGKLKAVWELNQPAHLQEESTIQGLIYLLK